MDAICLHDLQRCHSDVRLTAILSQGENAGTKRSDSSSAGSTMTAIDANRPVNPLFLHTLRPGHWHTAKRRLCIQRGSLKVFRSQSSRGKMSEEQHRPQMKVSYAVSCYRRSLRCKGKLASTPCAARSFRESRKCVSQEPLGSTEAATVNLLLFRIGD